MTTIAMQLAAARLAVRSDGLLPDGALHVLKTHGTGDDSWVATQIEKALACDASLTPR